MRVTCWHERVQTRASTTSRVPMILHASYVICLNCVDYSTCMYKGMSCVNKDALNVFEHGVLARCQHLYNLKSRKIQIQIQIQIFKFHWPLSLS